MPTEIDFVRDLTDRIIAGVVRLSAIDKARIAEEIRQCYGGDRPYVARNGESARALMVRRDQAIWHSYRRGEPAPLLARRHGISVRRVQQILSQQQRNGVS